MTNIALKCFKLKTVSIVLLFPIYMFILFYIYIQCSKCNTEYNELLKQ